jgi:tripartite-type tricarboxylate transporter receptor subunit TctC
MAFSRRTISRSLLVAAAALGVGISGAAAQAWPEKSITFMVPFPAGGGSDAFARPLAAELGKQLGKSIIIDNRGGAGGTLGAGLAAKAAPDGYTFFVGAVHHAIAPSVYPSLTYDLVNDFTPVAVMAVVPQVVVVHPSVQATNLKEFIALAKSQPGKLNYASAGSGTSHHLAGELFKAMAGVDILHVPYKGAGPALQDLIGGQVQVMFDGLGSSSGHIAGGRIKPLAVASKNRVVGAMNGIPTTAEAGLPGYEVSTWYALWAPAKTPPEIVNKMVAEMKTALSSDSLKKIWEQQGATTGPADPASMAAFVKDEIGRWNKVATEGKIKVE